MSVLTEMLRCPRSGERLVAATPEEMARAGCAPGSAAWVNESRAWLYRVEKSIPVLLPGEAVALGSSPLSGPGSAGPS